MSDHLQMRIDIHQHIWSEPLLEALARREELPFVREEQGLTVLFLAGEHPYVIDLEAESLARRAALVELDGLERALVCPSCPLGIEALPRREALSLIDAYHEGALALGEPFGVWGAIALEGLIEDDVDDLLARGCVGLALPAGLLAGGGGWKRIGPLLDRLQDSGAPLLVHPGPGAPGCAGEVSLSDPLWWPALTRYTAEMQAAWLSFLSAGRRSHPELRVVFSMLAGLAPLHAERLSSRGGPPLGEPDPLTFYDTSSYGPRAVAWMQDLVGPQQLLYGSDRPVVDPHQWVIPRELNWDLFAHSAARALAHPPLAQVAGR